MEERIKRVLEEQEMLDKANKSFIIERESGILLNLLMKIKKPKNVLEIGASIGYSSIWIAFALGKEANFITIEKRKERAEKAKMFFRKAGLKINLIEGDALKIMPKIKFDAVFIDGVKCKYLEYLKKIRLNKNALVIADNTISHAGKMNDFLDYAGKKGAVTLNIGDGLTLFIS